MDHSFSGYNDLDNFVCKVLSYSKSLTSIGKCVATSSQRFILKYKSSNFSSPWYSGKTSSAVPEVGGSIRQHHIFQKLETAGNSKHTLANYFLVCASTASTRQPKIYDSLAPKINKDSESHCDAISHITTRFLRSSVLCLKILINKC